MSPATAAPGSLRRFRFVAAGIVAAAAVAVGLLVAERRTAPPAEATRPTGPLVGAWGIVKSEGPGKPVWFCHHGGSARFTVAPDPPDCLTYVEVVGADLDRLRDRQGEPGGPMQGEAWVEGVYAHGRLTVVRQEPRYRTVKPEPAYPVPCARAPGGSPPASTSEVPSREFLLAWNAKHPHRILGHRPGWDGAGRPALVVSAVDREVVEAALRPRYGARVCVVESRYTRAQLDAAKADVERFRGGGSGVDHEVGPDGQPYVDAGVPILGEATEALVARHPAGLIRLNPWLTPLP